MFEKWIQMVWVMDGPLFFWWEGMRYTEKNCLQGQNKMFTNLKTGWEKTGWKKKVAEKSGKIIKNIMTKTEIKIIKY